jgi:hypothetical protein
MHGMYGRTRESSYRLARLQQSRERERDREKVYMYVCSYRSYDEIPQLDSYSVCLITTVHHARALYCPR